MHQRQKMRDAVVALLTGKTKAWDRVFPSRQVPWRAMELPGIAIYTFEESEESRKRKVTLAVLLVASLTERVDAELDDLALEVETVLASDLSLAGTALGSRYTGMAMEITEDQGVPIGAIRLNYEAWYLAVPDATLRSVG